MAQLSAYPDFYQAFTSGGGASWPQWGSSPQPASRQFPTQWEEQGGYERLPDPKWREAATTRSSAALLQPTTVSDDHSLDRAAQWGRAENYATVSRGPAQSWEARMSTSAMPFSGPEEQNAGKDDTTGERQRFLQEYPNYDAAKIDALRKKEYGRLDEPDYSTVYLDYTGGSLYAEHAQLEAFTDLLKASVLGNPH
eukprot:RCo008290